MKITEEELQRLSDLYMSAFYADDAEAPESREAGHAMIEGWYEQWYDANDTTEPSECLIVYQRVFLPLHKEVEGLFKGVE